MKNWLLQQKPWIPLAGALLCGCSAGENPADAARAEESAAGAQLVKANCKVCHGSGINGAPIIGNRKMWGPRIDQGEDTLVEHASNGFGMMPAKGGKQQLTEEQIRLAVRYMIARAAADN